ncbi:alpha/beta fold hydrolase [Methanobacterium sp. MBAC-LM]|uniref:alpha/beta fold hydrolase n=1 Tax=Methanobacterium sp. MBAC-LM TaxID=3412034 RepID=UPI003C70E289
MGLYFREIGQNNNETIIFLHAGMSSGWMWDKHLELLKDYHCLVPDLPEHGKSIEIKPFTMESAANEVIDIIRERAHGKKAHIVGLSLGAQVAVQILSMAPEVVDHAVITGTLVHEVGSSLSLFINIFYKIYMRLKDIDFFIKMGMKAQSIPLEYFEDVKKDTKSLTWSSLNNITRENREFRIPENLCRSKKRLLVLMGEKEVKVVYESALDLNKCLSNSKAYKVTNLGHTWPLESPELFSSVVMAWINDNQLPDTLVEL